MTDAKNKTLASMLQYPMSAELKLQLRVSRRSPRTRKLTERIGFWTFVMLLCGAYHLAIFYGENPVGHLWRSAWRLFCIGFALACATRDIRGSVGAI